MSDTSYSATVAPLTTGKANNPVVAKTADYQLTSEDCDGLKLFTNESASGTVKFTLPAAQAGLAVQVKTVAAQTLQVAVSGTNKIYTKDASAGVDGIENSSAGSTVCLLSTDGSNWYSYNEYGTWGNIYTFQGGSYGFTTGGVSSGVYKTEIEKFSLASNTTASSHGSLSVGRRQPTCSSSTTQGFAAGGYAGSYLASIEKFNFSSNTTATGHGNLATAVIVESTGHGSQTAGFSAGGQGQSIIQKYLYSSNSTSTSHGNCSSNRNCAAQSTYSDIAGYNGGHVNDAVSPNASIDKFNFASNTTAASHGNMSVAQFGGAGCSSSSQGFSAGYATAGGTMRAYIDKYNFASNTTATSHGNLATSQKYTASAVSGVSSGFAAGGYGGVAAGIVGIEKFDYASNTTAVTHGNLATARQAISGGCQV